MNSKVYASLTVLAATLTATLALLDVPLKTDAAPLGIISFELARDLARLVATHAVGHDEESLVLD